MNAIRAILYLFLVMMAVIVSCTQEQSQFHKGFPETIHVVSQQESFDKALMHYPFRVKINDSALFVMDLHPLKYYCHEFEYPSLKYKSSFAPKGKGPQELMGAENIIVRPNSSVYILDANRQKIFEHDYNDHVQISPIVELSEELIRSLDFTLYNDSIFIVPDYSGINRFYFINRDGKIVRKEGKIPGKKDDVADPARAQAWRSFVHYNPNNKILALATQLGEVIEIYDLQNNTVNVVMGPNGEPKYRVRYGYAEPVGIMGYSDVFVSDNYIYAIFWGHNFDQINSGDSLPEGGNAIHVFDLKGKPVRQYLLNCHITGFYIEELKGLIIGLDVNSDQQLVKLEMNPTDKI